MSALTGSSSLSSRITFGNPRPLTKVPVLVLNVHSRCNCRCVMCDIWKTSETRTLRAEDIAPHIDSMRSLGVEWVVFSGGEPLMNASLFQLAQLLRQQSIRLTLLSTGLLLSKYSAEVVACFDEVIVSLDGPPAVHDTIRRVPRAFERLAGGVSALRKLEAVFSVHARTTVQSANHLHLRGTVDNARTLELNSISFLAADVTSQAFNRELVWPAERQFEVALMIDEVAALENEIEALISEYSADINSGFITESPAKLRRIVSHFRAQLGLETPVSPACNAPWVSAVVESDGSVRPCFFHPIIGNLADGPLDSILNSADARQFRSSLNIADNPTCRRCVCSLNYQSQHGDQHAVGTR